MLFIWGFNLSQTILCNPNDIQIPTIEQEISNAGHADQVYDSCAKFLISKKMLQNKNQNKYDYPWQREKLSETY